MVRLTDEYDELDLDLSGPPPPRPANARRVGLYAFLAFVLAVACAFLVWERNETTATTKQMQKRLQALQDRRDKEQVRQEGVGDALVNLSDHAVAEAELHHSLGNRKQALANIDRAMHLFELAEKMGKCGCRDTAGAQVKRKMKALVEALKPTEGELPRLAALLTAEEGETEPASDEKAEDEALPQAAEPAGEP